MGRTKGTYTLTSNIEPKVGAPLDARTIVKLLADLTASNTFEYPYKGMKVFVEENNKSYTLVGSDPTISSNWTEDGSGGGHVIKNQTGTDMNQRSNLQFVDMTLSDDAINDITKVENIHVIQSESELANLPDGLYMLDDDEGTVIDSDLVGYDNTDSGLEADNVQDAVDEVVSDLDDKVDKVAGKGLSTNDFTNEDKALIGQTLGNNAVLTTDKTPFLTRQTLNPTGFSGYVREKLVGASYAWNQLVQNGNFANGTTSWACIKGSASVSNGIATVTPTEYDCQLYESFVGRYIVGHKYLVTGRIKTSGTTDIHLRFLRASKRVEQVSTWQTVSMIAIAPADVPSGYQYVWFNDLRTSGWDAWQCTEIQVIDLTLAFGSTIADYLYGLSDNGGITKLRDMGFSIDKYTPYGYGLYSVKTCGKKIYGYYSKPTIISGARGSTGTITANGTRTITDDYILLAPNVYKLYAKTSVNGKTLRVAYHFWANTTVGQNSQTYDSGWLNISESMDLVISSNVIFDMGFSYSDNSNINPSDLEVKLVANETTYSLGNDELRGKFDLVNGEIVASGDVKESNGGITRNWKLVDLGSLNYDYISNGTFFQIQSVMSDIKASAIVLSAKYVNNVPSSVNSDNMIIGVTTSKYLRIRDTAYTDATTFKTALNGVYAIIELATPTTEQSTPFADPMSMVGATTEEYIDTRDIPCPVGAERQYMGQSEDVIEIPSMPQSDGKWVQKCITSGGKQQIVWEEDSEEQTKYNGYEELTSSRYIFPCDGYVTVSSEAITSGSVRLQLTDSTNSYGIGGIFMNITGQYQVQSLFVKKGMGIRVIQDVTGTRKRFYPLV